MVKNDFLKILQSVDAFFPIGAFTLSNGLEDYVITGRIKTHEELETYLKGFIQMFPYQDLGLLHLSYCHAEKKDALIRLDQLANAMKSAMEVRGGSSKMCVRYLKARESMGDCGGMLKWYFDQIRRNHLTGFHPIALGIYGASLDIEEDLLLCMYSYSVLSAIVNNAVKLVPLSQMEGQRILLKTLGHLETVVEKVRQIQETDLGVSGGAFEIHCMNHEQLYSRLYMS